MRTVSSLIIVLFFFFAGFGQKPQTGKASFYAKSFAGKLTASGERFNPKEYTAAHRHFPFGTKIRITNLANDRSIVVRINDRGPYVSDRIIDVSPITARKLGFIKRGVANVHIKKVDHDTEINGKISAKRKEILPVKADSVTRTSRLSKLPEFIK